MNNKVCAVTIADEQNMKFYSMLKNSWGKFHPDIELKLIAGDDLKNRLKKDPMLFYRFTPIIASELMAQGYETVIKIDADSIITSSLTHILEDTDEYDVGVVLNDLPLRVWDCQTYWNAGFVVMKSPNFVEHWKYLCFTDHFNTYQYKEQDLLSIIASDYFPYKVKCYDFGDKMHGLVAKPGWNRFKMEDGKVVADTPQGKKELVIIHFAGGNDPVKGNYRTRFQEDVIEYIESLIK